MFLLVVQLLETMAIALDRRLANFVGIFRIGIAESYFVIFERWDSKQPCFFWRTT